MSFLLLLLFPISLSGHDGAGRVPEPDPAGRISLQRYELYANVTAYHNGPGDELNGGPRNYMGLPLRTGYSAAGPAALAGYLVEVPDFDPERRDAAVSDELRSFIRKKGYSSYFVIDDIGRWITFLRDGRRVESLEDWTLAELSAYSLSRGEPVIDIDVMIPDERLARSYRNRRCLVRIYAADLGSVRWVRSSGSAWKGRKPVFDTLERHRRYMSLLGSGA